MNKRKAVLATVMLIAACMCAGCAGFKLKVSATYETPPAGEK